MSGRVGCFECGDEYWDRAPGQRCDCGASLHEFTETGDSDTLAKSSGPRAVPYLCAVDIRNQG